MEYSLLFVCLMGMGTVFFGLICLVILSYLMSVFCRSGKKQLAAASAPQTAPDGDRQAFVAAVSAALAEELGTDVTGIRILSMKKK